MSNYPTGMSRQDLRHVGEVDNPAPWFEYAIEERFPEAVNIDDLWEDFCKWCKSADLFETFDDWAKQLDRNKIERLDEAA